MLGTSFGHRCTLILLIFANLLANGLTQVGSDDNGRSIVATSAQPQPNDVPSTTEPGASVANDTGTLVPDRPRTGKSDNKGTAQPDNPAINKSDNATGNGDNGSVTIVPKEESTSATMTSTVTMPTAIRASTESEKGVETVTIPVTEEAVTRAPSDGINATVDSESSGSIANSTDDGSEPVDAARNQQLAVPVKSEDLPSSLVALSMAIAFAIVVVVVYVGLLAWRRYLEYRYGNRELLVNDLEFDTNDLRHFEL